MKPSLCFLALLALGCTSGSAQSSGVGKASPLPLPFRLTSDGHACSGYFRLTEHTMDWKYSSGHCRASSWTSSQEKDGTWLFFLKQTPAEQKSCPMAAVQMRPRPYFESFWDVALYESIEQFRQHPDLPALDCPYMSQ